MSFARDPRKRTGVQVAVFSWATGLLAGVLFAAVATFLPVASPAESPVSRAPQRRLPMPSPTPNCPGPRIWSQCDPVPRTQEDMEKALMSDAVGWIDFSPPDRWSVRIDGLSYGQVRWKRQPIAPGQHTVDLFDYQGMQHVRCGLEIMQRRRFRALVDAGGDCVISEIPVDSVP